MSDVQKHKLVEPWPLGITSKRPLISALIVMVAAFATFWVSGAAFGEVSPWEDANPRLATGMSLTYTVLLAYLVGIAGYAANRVREFGHSLGPDVSAAGRAILNTLNRVSRQRLWAATAVGLVLAALNSRWDVVVAYDGSEQWLVHTSLALGSTLVWVVAARLIYMPVSYTHLTLPTIYSV